MERLSQKCGKMNRYWLLRINDELCFAVDNDGTNILVIINKGEITGAVDIDNMYEFASSHCDDFKDLRDDEDIVINQEWILNKLSENENE